MERPLRFNKGTLPVVEAILTEYQGNGRRLRLFYGDKLTGQDWGEEDNTVGYIGRSCGSYPVPLLINNNRSSGGPAISTSCIVKIVEISSHQILYMHPKYHASFYDIRQVNASKYPFELYRSGELYARLSTEKKAIHLAMFFLGARHRK